MDKLAIVDPVSRLSREMVKAIAADIGASTSAYIEVMYPEAVSASSSTFLLSLRNHVHNEIVNVMLEEKHETPEQWLKRRAQFRREWRAAYRKIRRNKLEGQ